MDNQKIRKLAIALLDDNEGINERAWNILQELLEESNQNQDLIGAVKSTDGRFYIPATTIEFT